MSLTVTVTMTLTLTLILTLGPLVPVEGPERQLQPAHAAAEAPPMEEHADVHPLDGVDPLAAPVARVRRLRRRPPQPPAVAAAAAHCVSVSPT